MKRPALRRRIGAVLVLAAVPAALAFAQVRMPAESLGGPLSGPPVFGAPFTAVATTTVHVVLRDGTRIDQSLTDRYYRDSAGRVRIERQMNGLPAPKTTAEWHLRTIIAPGRGTRGAYGDRAVFTVDPQTRTAWHSARDIMSMTVGGNNWLSVPVGGVRFVDFKRAGDLLSEDPTGFADVRDEPLGSRRIAGVATTGRRISLVVPAGYEGNTRPIQMSDERWESPELQLLIASRHVDSRGTIEYWLSSVERGEPPSHLFEIPEDYGTTGPTVVKGPVMSFTSADNPHVGEYLAGRWP